MQEPKKLSKGQGPVSGLEPQYMNPTEALWQFLPVLLGSRSNFAPTGEKRTRTHDVHGLWYVARPLSSDDVFQVRSVRYRAWSRAVAPTSSRGGARLGDPL